MTTTTLPQSLRQYYENEYLLNHPDLDVGDVRAKFEALRPLLDQAAACTPSSIRQVTEVGCGSGTLLKMASDYLEAQGVGLDLSASILSKARQMAPGLSFLQANAEQLPLALDRCDLLMFADLVEHVPRPRLFLHNLREVQNVVMLVPLESGWLSDLVYRYRRLVGKPTNYETCGHLSRWNKRTALKLIRASGLNLVSFRVQRGKVTRYTTWRGRLYGGLSHVLFRLWPELHRRALGGYTLLALCRRDAS